MVQRFLDCKHDVLTYPKIIEFSNLWRFMVKPGYDLSSFGIFINLQAFHGKTQAFPGRVSPKPIR